MTHAVLFGILTLVLYLPGMWTCLIQVSEVSISDTVSFRLLQQQPQQVKKPCCFQYARLSNVRAACMSMCVCTHVYVSCGV